MKLDTSCLNRTFMELKQGHGQTGIPTVESLNRTFMELKHINQVVSNAQTDGLNRTFMELKLICSVLLFRIMLGS